MAEDVQAEVQEVESETEVELVDIDQTEEGQESEATEEEFEIVRGSVDEPSTEEKKKVRKQPRAVTRLLDQRNKARDEGVQKDQRIAELEQQLVGQRQTTAPVNAPSMPIAPTDESVNYDSAALVLAQQKYSQEINQYQSDLATNAAQAVYDQQQTTTQRAQEQEQHNSVINAHYERAEKLNLPDYDAAESALVDVLDQNAVVQIAKMVPNSEAVVYYLGKNPAEALRIREIWERNPAQVAFELGGLSKDLKIVPKRNKQRLAPESTISGAAPKGATALDREIAEEQAKVNSGEKMDFTHLFRLKKQRRKQASE